jgi:pyrimidine operon attenuation protein/uracil phosphoribosyltransferase
MSDQSRPPDPSSELVREIEALVEDVLGRVGRVRGALAAFSVVGRDERLELVTRCLFRERP